MLLNRFEAALVNSRLRIWWQDFYEIPKLKRLGGKPIGNRVLEVGCGSGRGSLLLPRHFGSLLIDAFDADEKMLSLAQLNRGKTRIRSLWQGSVTSIPCPDSSYDAVFCFNVLHHVEDWQRGLSEISRVLRPGGKFYAHETLHDFIKSSIWGRLMNHPFTNRFDALAFLQEIRDVGLSPLHPVEIEKNFLWLVAKK